jgi:hypothetical protein
MRPKATKPDLPTTYDMKVYLHNQFVKHVQKLKGEITIRKLPPHQRSEVNIYLSGRLQGKYQLLQMGGQLTPRKPGFLV